VGGVLTGLVRAGPGEEIEITEGKKKDGSKPTQLHLKQNKQSRKKQRRNKTLLHTSWLYKGGLSRRNLIAGAMF